MKNEAAAQLGKSGGLKKSEKKTAACRKNASKPRARWVSAFRWEFESETGEVRSGIELLKGKKVWDIGEDWEQLKEMIESADMGGHKIKELLAFSSIAKKI